MCVSERVSDVGIFEGTFPGLLGLASLISAFAGPNILAFLSECCLIRVPYLDQWGCFPV